MRSSACLKQTDLKASEGFDKLLSGHLVKATHIQNKQECFGIVVSFEKIEEELLKRKKQTLSDDWKNQIWAIWCESKHEAIKRYENVDDDQFVPKSVQKQGSLTNISPREYEFEIID